MATTATRASLCRRVLQALLPRFLAARLLYPPLEDSKKRDGETAPAAADPELRAAFKASTALFGEQQAGSQRFENHTLLTAYSLYKQATAGDAPTHASASMFDVRGAAKLKYWQKQRGMPQAEAMQLYIALVEHGAPAAAADGPSAEGEGTLDGMPLELLDEAMKGMAGPVASQMAVLEGEDLERRAEAERWPLHEAARCGDAALCARLVAQGVELDSADADADTALHWACDSGHLAAAERLLELGASADAQNAQGSTALHNACACGHVKTVELLLSHGATPGMEDEDGCTPADVADPENADAIRRLLDGVRHRLS